MSQTVEELETVYEKVKSKLDKAEQNHITSLKARRDAGEIVYYGHDLSQAIRRAERRLEVDKANELLDLIRQHNLGISRGSAAFLFSMGLSRIIQAAAKEGVSAEDVRHTLQRELEQEGHFKIEHVIERTQNEASRSD